MKIKGLKARLSKIKLFLKPSLPTSIITAFILTVGLLWYCLKSNNGSGDVSPIAIWIIGGVCAIVVIVIILKRLGIRLKKPPISLKGINVWWVIIPLLVIIFFLKPWNWFSGKEDGWEKTEDGYYRLTLEVSASSEKKYEEEAYWDYWYYPDTSSCITITSPINPLFKYKWYHGQVVKATEGFTPGWYSIKGSKDTLTKVVIFKKQR